MRLKQRLAVLLAGCLVATGVTLVSGTAAFANPVCTDYVTIQTPSGTYELVPVAGGSPNCFLAQGDYSYAVWGLQNTLDTCYQMGIATDSDFGPQTKSALAWVQGHVLHITADGVYGTQTRNAMSFTTTGLNVHCFPYS